VLTAVQANIEASARWCHVSRVSPGPMHRPLAPRGRGLGLGLLGLGLRLVAVHLTAVVFRNRTPVSPGTSPLLGLCFCNAIFFRFGFCSRGLSTKPNGPPNPLPPFSISSPESRGSQIRRSHHSFHSSPQPVPWIQIQIQI
jgi:hypothetical protein